MKKVTKEILAKIEKIKPAEHIRLGDTIFREVLVLCDDSIEFLTLSSNTYVEGCEVLYVFPNGQDYANSHCENEDDFIDAIWEEWNEWKYWHLDYDRTAILTDEEVEERKRKEKYIADLAKEADFPVTQEMAEEYFRSQFPDLHFQGKKPQKKGDEWKVVIREEIPQIAYSFSDYSVRYWILKKKLETAEEEVA